MALTDTAKKDGSRIEYWGHPTDHDGRCNFTLYWMTDYHPGHSAGEHGWGERAQCFHADPRAYGFPRPEDASPTFLKAQERQKEINWERTAPHHKAYTEMLAKKRRR